MKCFRLRYLGRQRENEGGRSRTQRKKTKGEEEKRGGSVKIEQRKEHKEKKKKREDVEEAEIERERERINKRGKFMAVFSRVGALKFFSAQYLNEILILWSWDSLKFITALAMKGSNTNNRAENTTL